MSIDIELLFVRENIPFQTITFIFIFKTHLNVLVQYSFNRELQPRENMKRC